MAVWVVLLTALVNLALGTAQRAAGIADGTMLLAVLAIETIVVGRRHRARAPRREPVQAPRREERALPAWVASPLLTRPTPERMRRCGRLPAGGSGVGHDKHIGSRHVA